MKSALIHLRRQPFNQCWRHVIRQMIQELRYRVDSLLACRTARYNDALAALRDRWRLVNEIRKIVTLNFFLDCGKQNRFLHGSDS
jgi:hypothetical protein